MADRAENVNLQTFLSEFQEGEKLHISPEQYDNALELEQHELAELVHVHRNTVRRMPKSLQLQKYFRESIHVLTVASDLVGRASKGASRYRNQPLSNFNYKTAEVLVFKGRASDVVRYVTCFPAGQLGEGRLRILTRSCETTTGRIGDLKRLVSSPDDCGSEFRLKHVCPRFGECSKSAIYERRDGCGWA